MTHSLTHSRAGAALRSLCEGCVCLLERSVGVFMFLSFTGKVFISTPRSPDRRFTPPTVTTPLSALLLNHARDTNA